MAWGKEDRLQISVVNYLEAAYRDLLVFHVPNGGNRNRLEAIKFKNMGVKAGAPDLILIPSKSNRGIHPFYFIELKADTRQSKTQLVFENECLVRGVGYAVCHSVEDVELALKAWQIDRGKPPVFNLERAASKVF